MYKWIFLYQSVIYSKFIIANVVFQNVAYDRDEIFTNKKNAPVWLRRLFIYTKLYDLRKILPVPDIDLAGQPDIPGRSHD